MKNICLLLWLALPGWEQQQAYPPAKVDYGDYEALVSEVRDYRAQRLVSLDDFLQKAKDPHTVILDTRSKVMYDYKHVKGAVHLDFSDFTQAALDDLMRQYNGTATRILIYCNNNFEDRTQLSGMDRAFITKAATPGPPVSPGDIAEESSPAGKVYMTLALNIPTFINLYGYGYRNIYELAEWVDVNDPRIEFEGTSVLNRQ